jgi:hypothetical protein
VFAANEVWTSTVAGKDTRSNCNASLTALSKSTGAYATAR